MINVNANSRSLARWSRRVRAVAAVRAADARIGTIHALALQRAAGWRQHGAALLAQGIKDGARYCYSQARAALQYARSLESQLESLAWREFVVALLDVAK